MFASMRKIFKYGAIKKAENQKIQTYYMFAMLKGALEDIMFWKSPWLSLSFILFVNLFFFVCVYKQISILELMLCCYTFFIVIDAFEVWLKYKHRTKCLEKLSDHHCPELNTTVTKVKNWMYIRWSDFMYLRETNHTQAFLLMNLILGIVLIIGKYINGYLLSYILSMLLCVFYKVIPSIIKIVKKMQQGADSDIEYDGLLPEVSDIDIKLLSIEPEPDQLFDEKQSLDYWKPDDLPIEEVSDSSDNSSSLATNLSLEKMQTLDKDVETSDSSGDEYMPMELHKDHLKSTMEIIEPSASWTSSAMNTLWNITGAMSNIIYAKPDENKRRRVESIDSSDGFEMIDKRDVM